MDSYEEWFANRMPEQSRSNTEYNTMYYYYALLPITTLEILRSFAGTD